MTNSKYRYLEGSPFETYIDRTKEKKVSSKAGFYGLMFLIGAFAGVFLVVLAFSAITGREVDLNSPLVHIAMYTGQYGLGILLCLAIISTYKKVKIQENKLGFVNFILIFFFMFTIAEVGSLIGIASGSVLGYITGLNLTDPIQEFNIDLPLWASIFVSVIIAPVMEELIFRKILIDRTVVYGNGLTIFISALVFALIHSNIYQFFYVILLGAVFGFIYVYTGRIRYTIILHMLFNLFGGALPETFTYMSEKGMRIGDIFSNIYSIAMYVFEGAGIICCIVLVIRHIDKVRSFLKNAKYNFPVQILNPGMVILLVASLASILFMG